MQEGFIELIYLLFVLFINFQCLGDLQVSAPNLHIKITLRPRKASPGKIQMLQNLWKQYHHSGVKSCTRALSLTSAVYKANVLIHPNKEQNSNVHGRGQITPAYLLLLEFSYARSSTYYLWVLVH